MHAAGGAIGGRQQMIAQQSLSSRSALFVVEFDIDQRAQEQADVGLWPSLEAASDMVGVVGRLMLPARSSARMFAWAGAVLAVATGAMAFAGESIQGGDRPAQLGGVLDRLGSDV